MAASEQAFASEPAANRSPTVVDAAWVKRRARAAAMSRAETAGEPAAGYDAQRRWIGQSMVFHRKGTT